MSNQNILSQKNTVDTEAKEPFKLDVRVYIEDTDAGGIVYYVNYLKFMERSRTEFFRSLGYHKAAILEGGLLFVVHGVKIDYQKSARLDDVLVITTQVVKVARSYVEFEQKVIRHSEASFAEVLCKAEVRIACVNSMTMRPSAMPADVHKQLVAHSS